MSQLSDNQSFADVTRDVFGDVAVKYWDDYGNAIVARWDLVDNPCRPGVEVNFDPWQNFLLEGMRSIDAAEKVTQQFVFWDAMGFDSRVISISDTDGVFSVEGEDGVYLSRSRSMLIDEARRAIYGQLIEEGRINQNEVNQQIDKAIETIVNAVFDPAGTLADVLKDSVGVIFEDDDPSGSIDVEKSKDQMRDIISGKTGEWAGSLVDYTDPDLQAFKDLRDQVKGATDDWEQKAAETLRDNDWIPPVKAETVINGHNGEPVVTETHIWTGRPEGYEYTTQGLDGPPRKVRFTEGPPDHPVLRDVQAMKVSDPLAYQAYLNWLQDPAMQAKMSSVDPFRNYHRPSGR